MLHPAVLFKERRRQRKSAEEGSEREEHRCLDEVPEDAICKRQRVGTRHGETSPQIEPPVNKLRTLPTRKTDPATTTRPFIGVACKACVKASEASVAAAAPAPVEAATASSSSIEAVRGESTGVTTTWSNSGNRIC